MMVIERANAPSVYQGVFLDSEKLKIGILIK